MSKNNFWEEKAVLVTGATGFIGSWLAESLVNSGAKVTIIAKKGETIGTKSVDTFLNRINVETGDIRDQKFVEDVSSEKEIIFHLAAVTQVLYSIKNPRETVEVDVTGTLNFLEAIRNNNANTFFVFASTDKVYGEPKYVPIDEGHSLSAKSPYDASKLGADQLVQSYNTTYGIKTAISRCSNVIGGRDSNILRAIPSFVYAIMNDKNPKIRSNGKMIRDYMYVDDAVRAIMTLGEKQQKTNGFAFNFGTGKPTTVLELADEVLKNFGKTNVKLEILNETIKGEIERQYLSNKLAREKLGWEPQTIFSEGVRKSVEWYKKNSWWLEVMEEEARSYL